MELPQQDSSLTGIQPRISQAGWPMSMVMAKLVAGKTTDGSLDAI